MSCIPYSLRLGKAYQQSVADISVFNHLDSDEKKREIVQRVSAAVRYAYANNDFYRKLYIENDFHPEEIHSFEDLSRIPLVEKRNLRKVGCEDRSTPQPGRMKINTGGTSGEPLDFYIDKDAFAREWGHMHRIWSRLNYKPTDLKLTFRGKNLGNLPLRYNAVHNEYLVNAYCPSREVLAALEKVGERIRFFHGYPSAIYEFVKYCHRDRPELLELFRENLKGIFFGSEHLAPVYRDEIERKLNVPTISWYGHSEMAILAHEIEPYIYRPFYSYGFCEAVKDNEGHFKLVGTSYYNLASPFIRYDTGDLIDPIFKDGLLQQFRVTSGRIGDFIIDLGGHRISLTALIFGRHHDIFKDAKFIQISQDTPGRATLLITLEDDKATGMDSPAEKFDLSNIDIEFDYRILKEPFRTSNGKVPLRVGRSDFRLD